MQLRNDKVYLREEVATYFRNIEEKIYIYINVGSTVGLELTSLRSRVVCSNTEPARHPLRFPFMYVLCRFSVVFYLC